VAGRINGVHHIALSVPSLEQARDFYVGLLGFEEGSSGSWEKGTEMNDRIMRLTGSSGRAMFVKAGNIFLEFFEFATPAPAPLEPDRPVCNYGYTHIALDVSDLASVHARLSAAGMDFHTDPLSGYGVTTTYGRDPFGNVIELQEIHEDEHVKRVPLP
jgi:catechol 2,3-dioxygenase-like lactoylglutathione lyase family enzyme